MGTHGSHHSGSLDALNSISSNSVAPVSGSSQGSHGGSGVHRAPSRSSKGTASEMNSFFPGSNNQSALPGQASSLSGLYDQTNCDRLNGPHSSGANHSAVSNRRTPNSNTTPLQSPISANTTSHQYPPIASNNPAHLQNPPHPHSGGQLGPGGMIGNPNSQLTSSQHLSQQQHMSSVSPSAESSQNNTAALIINSNNAAAAAALASRSTPNNSLATSAVTASIVQHHHQQQQQQIAAAQLAAAAAQVSYLDPSATYSLLAQQQLAAYHRALGISQPQTSPQQPPQPQSQTTTSPVVDQIAHNYRLAAAAAASGIDGTTQVLLNPAIMNSLFTAG